MNAILSGILDIYLITVVSSIGIKLAKEYFANKRIEKKGLTITKGDKEPQEYVYDIVKEYFYTLVPIRNIKKSWKLIWGNNKKYTEEKIARLQQEGRIKKSDEVIDESTKEQPKPKKQEEKKKETTTKQSEKLVVDEYINEINNSTNIEFISAIKTTYRKKSLALRERHAKLKEMLKTSTNEEFKKKIKKEMSGIARRVNAYDQIFVAARDRLFELKQKQTSNQRIK